MKLIFDGYKIHGTASELAEFISELNNRIDAAPEPLPAKKPGPVPKNKRELDMGKVKALRDAGWTLAKIADEMGVAPQTIANRLKEVEA